MPKIKLNVGAEFDVLSKDELDSSLKSSVSDFARLISDGIRYGKSATGSLTSTGLQTTPTYTGGYTALPNIGPNPGYVWSVKNLTYLGFPTNGADLLINGYSNGDIAYALFNGANANGTTIVGSNGLIIPAGNEVYLGFRGNVTSAQLVLYYEEVKLEDIGKL